MNVADDDDPPPVPVPAITITKGPDVTEADPGDSAVHATFTLRANPAPTGTLTVTVTVTDTPSGSWIAGSAPTTVTFAANAATAVLSVQVTADNDDEPNGSITAAIASGTGYTGAGSATVNVADDDDPPPMPVPAITITKGPDVTEADPGDSAVHATFTLTASPPPTGTLTVNVTLTDTPSGSWIAGSAPTTVTFAANAATAVLSVQVTADNDDEPNGRITATIASGTGYTGRGIATVNATDDDVPQVRFDASFARSFAEGETIRFPLIISPVPVVETTVGVTVNFSSPEFRQSAPDRVTFAAGSGLHGSEATAILTITTAIAAGTDTGQITISANPGPGYTRATNTASHTITLRDTTSTTVRPRLTIRPVTASIREGRAAVFRLSSSLTLPGALTVRLQAMASPAGFVQGISLPARVTIPANADEALLTIQTQELAGSATGTLTVQLQAMTAYELGTPARAEVAITNRVVPVVGIAANTNNQTQREGSSFTFRVTVAPRPDSDTIVTVRYTTANGSALAGNDYTNTSGTLRFDTSNTSQLITVQGRQDQVYEEAEQFSLTLSNPTNASLGLNTATATITDDDDITVTVQAVATSVAEANGARARFQLSLTDGLGQPRTAQGALSFDYTLSGTAVAGTDYTDPPNKRVGFAARQTAAVVTVALLDDNVVEGNKTLTIAVTDPALSGQTRISLANNTASVTITDSDEINVALRQLDAAGTPLDPPARITLGQPVRLAVLASQPVLAAATIRATLNFTDRHNLLDRSSLPPNSCTATGGSYACNVPITMAAGESRVALTITTNASSAALRGSATAAINFALQAIQGAAPGAPTSLPLTFGNPLPTLNLTAGVPTPVRESTANGAPFRLTISPVQAVAITVRITVAEAGGNYLTATPPTTVTLPANAGAVSFNVPLDDDAVDEQAAAVLVTLARSNEYLTGTGTARVLVQDDDGPVVSITAASTTVTEGDALPITISLSASPVETTRVTVTTADLSTHNNPATANTDYTPLNQAVIFAAGTGTLTQQLILQTVDDNAVESAEVLSVQLTGATNDATLAATSSIRLSITDNDTTPAPVILPSANTTTNGAVLAGTMSNFPLSGTAQPGALINVALTAAPAATRAGAGPEGAGGGGSGGRIGECSVSRLSCSVTAGADGSWTTVLDLSGFADGNITISVTATLLGHESAPTTFTVVKDTRGPTITIAAPDALGTAQYATLTFTLSEVATAFAQSALSVSAGTLSDFTGAGTRYTARYTAPVTAGPVTIVVAAAAVTDQPGNPSAEASHTISIQEQNIQATIAVAAGATAITADDPAVFVITLTPPPTSTLLVALAVSQRGNFLAAGTNLTPELRATSGSLRLTLATSHRPGTTEPGMLFATVAPNPGYTPTTPATATLAVLPRTDPTVLADLNQTMLAHVALTLTDEMATTLHDRMLTLFSSDNVGNNYAASDNNALKIRGQSVPGFIASLARPMPRHRPAQATASGSSYQAAHRH